LSAEAGDGWGDSFDMQEFKSSVRAAGDRFDALDPNSIFNANAPPSNNSIVNLLDNDSSGDTTTSLSSTSSGLPGLLTHDVIPRDEIDKQWQVVIFGRCPDPDFSAPIKERRANNITCAYSLYAEMLEQGIEPDCDTLSAYMSVASEAMQWEKAHAIVDIFKNQHDISPDSTTFKNLIRMHIFMSDINGCMERFQEMKSRGISPDRETYGLIVATLTHRDDLVKAVQVLEEADENGIQISNRHIKKLRARFNKLNIRHPNIFPDPNLWVKDLRIVRENKKNARTGNKLQYLNSLTFL
jgi:pentatricopeptide repeat protein